MTSQRATSAFSRDVTGPEVRGRVRRDRGRPRSARHRECGGAAGAARGAARGCRRDGAAGSNLEHDMSEFHHGHEPRAEGVALHQKYQGTLDYGEPEELRAERRAGAAHGAARGCGLARRRPRPTTSAHPRLPRTSSHEPSVTSNVPRPSQPSSALQGHPKSTSAVTQGLCGSATRSSRRLDRPA